MPTHSFRPSAAKNSPDARRLCRAALKKFKTERNAARALRMLPTEFHHQLIGDRRDTPAMLCALKRADARAKRARFWLIDEHGDGTIDRISFEMLLREAKQAMQKLESLAPKSNP